MNAAAFSAVKRFETTQYVGPINPPVSLRQKGSSKFRRVIRLQGAFYFFSHQRLQAVAHAVHSRCCPDAQLDFFHGFTPWILTKPERPYMAWSDCTFRDYVDIFHRREQFCSDDLGRIEQAEAAWLRNARRILFTSQWAADRAVRDYSLDVRRVASVGIFGEIDMPAQDSYTGRKEFVFVSTNFEAKGGRMVLDAFRDVRKRHPDAFLTIVGDRPSRLPRETGVTYVGFLRKEIPLEYRRFQEILGGARALVNATKCDTCPVLLVEAGYVGCPAISVRKFAIPELIDDGSNGILLDDPPLPSAIASAMIRMLQDNIEYEQMRKSAWVRAREMHSKKRFEEQFLAQLAEEANRRVHF